MTATTARPPDVLAIHRWGTNAKLIADVVRLGFFDNDPLVLDATYGPKGGFWKKHRPRRLIASDLIHPDGDLRADALRPPFRPGTFDIVVWDPPYKLNGTPHIKTTDYDHRFGTDRADTYAGRLDLLTAGAVALAALVKPRGLLMTKSKDQVAWSQMRWQSDDLRDVLVPLGFTKEARFDFVTTPMPQRSQKRARNNASQLIIWRAP